MEEMSMLSICCQNEKYENLVDSLPDDLLEAILSFLPTQSIVRAAAVCKKWHHAIYARVLLCTNTMPQSPWFISWEIPDYDKGVLVYDSALESWYRLPLFEKVDSVFVEKYEDFLDSPSCGLLYLILDHEICLFNPITSSFQLLLQPSYIRHLSKIGLSRNRNSHDYMLAIVQFMEEYIKGDSITLSITTYESGTKSWSTGSEVLRNLIWIDLFPDVVICDGTLYFMVRGEERLPDKLEYGCPILIRYDLSNIKSSLQPSLLGTSIKLPSGIEDVPILMNLNGRLVLVGNGKSDEARWVRIWELQNSSWHELCKMSDELVENVEHLGSLGCRGANEHIFFPRKDGTGLVLFDIVKKEWKWSKTSPTVFGAGEAFCFEPRIYTFSSNS